MYHPIYVSSSSSYIATHVFFVFTILLTQVLVVSLTDVSSSSLISNNTTTNTCQFYLAESSIPNSGFGIYTVKGIPKGSYLMPNNTDAPSIVITDIDKHNQGVDPLWNHINYVWAGEGWADYESDTIWESVPNFGSLSNFHTYLYNIKPLATPYDDTLLSTTTTSSSRLTMTSSPGMGAYTYYGGYNFQAVKDIDAGDEIFANYGESWLEGRPTLAGKAPTEHDFTIASNIVNTMWKGLGENTTDGIIQMIQKVVHTFQSRTSSILPKTLDEYVALIPSSTKSPDSKTQGIGAKLLAKTTILPRTIEWITTHGMCLDHIISKPSTLPHAGRGAFASRFIPKGTVIVPVPLLQVPRYHELFMYNLKKKSKDDTFIARSISLEDATSYNSKEDGDEHWIGTQLLINYCFSHFETPLLLCPQTSAILVNHCSTRTSYGGDCARYNSHMDKSHRGPNAIVRWATTWDPDTQEWLKLNLKDIETKTEEGKRGLSMEYVATRDIYPGDEIFIDYGLEWELLWEKHVSEWQPPQFTNFIPVKEMNDNMQQLRTLEELSIQPYPENVRLGCIYWTEEGESDESSKVTSNTEQSSWHTYDGDKYTFETNLDGWHWPCKVLMRNSTDDTYTVEIFQSPSADKTTWVNNGERRMIENFRRSSIQFFPAKRSSDQHLPKVFRQPIGMMDSMVPQQWRYDRYQK